MPPLTLGTAGHIDHGKTALIKALTGVETDRLPEERRRGMTIELGYAPLRLPSGRRLSVVDVPGHERLVRTMVAGATGIDLFLMVVAADDGVMPQTVEHAKVLNALGIYRGVIAITKTDLKRGTPNLSALALQAPVVSVSAQTGAGLDELRSALDDVAEGTASRPATGLVRLHVDRVFTIRGAGTVVTGTLWSGRVHVGDEVRLLPSVRTARVRGVQVHDFSVEHADAGQRVALNLAGVRRSEVARGDVVATGELEPTYRIEAAVPGELPARVMVHHGTRESPARAVARDAGVWQLRLEQPLLAEAADRVVVRAIAPPDTLGGGLIVDPHPPRSGRPEPEPESGPPAPHVEDETGPAPLTAAALEAEAVLAAGGHQPPADSDLPAAPPDLAALREHGRAVRIGPSQHIHAEALADAQRRLVALFEREGTVTLAAFRDELGTSRKYAQALLEHFDSERLTLRRGDERVLRRRR